MGNIPDIIAARPGNMEFNAFNTGIHNSHGTSGFLDQALCDAFAKDGFVVLRALIAPSELTWLPHAYDILCDSHPHCGSRNATDSGTANDDHAAGRPPQIAWPSRRLPALRQTQMHCIANNAARALLGPDAELVWECVNDKPAKATRTPWHQDAASFTTSTPYQEAVSCWVPLRDVDEVSGCMEYVPGSHHGPLLPAMAQEIPATIAVPLRAGDAVLYHSRTLHSAGPNLSRAARRAVVLGYAIKKPERMTEHKRRAVPWPPLLRRLCSRVGL